MRRLQPWSTEKSGGGIRIGSRTKSWMTMTESATRRGVLVDIVYYGLCFDQLKRWVVGHLRLSKAPGCDFGVLQPFDVGLGARLV